MVYYNRKIVNIKQAIKFLNWCRTIHWRYTKHPKWCRGNVGVATITITLLENMTR